MTNVVHIDVAPEGGGGRWFEAALLELSVKQARLEEAFGLSRWTGWKADLAKGKLAFLDATGPRVECQVQVAGSTGGANWMWAWANGSLPDAIAKAAERVRAFGEAHKLSDLMETHVVGDDLDELGWRLAAAAAKVAEAEGVYRAPSSKGAVFLLMYDVKAVGAA